MELEQIMNEKLTIDSHAKKLEDNYRGLLETPKFKRDIDQERYIKLNRLERKEEPMKVREGDFTYLYCPVCGNKFEVWVQLDPYCSKCGQRLKL